MSFMAVPSMCEALGSVLETRKRKQRKNRAGDGSK